MNRRQLVKYGASTVIAHVSTGVSGLVAMPTYAATPVKIGLLIPLSGVATMYGALSRNCAEIAVSEINARGWYYGTSY
jgi:ABC-type branched-subunit amino acid transport system substrate-binding protein